MAAIKSYSDLQQSKKLAEILPLESADMYYFRQFDSDYFPPFVESIYPIPLFKDGKEDFNYDIRCWSLAALLGVLPEGTRLLKSTNISSIGDTKYHCYCPKGNIDVWFDNPVDACVEMIQKLHELKML